MFDGNSKIEIQVRRANFGVVGVYGNSLVWSRPYNSHQFTHYGIVNLESAVGLSHVASAMCRISSWRNCYRFVNEPLMAHILWLNAALEKERIFACTGCRRWHKLASTLNGSNRCCCCNLSDVRFVSPFEILTVVVIGYKITNVCKSKACIIKSPGGSEGEDLGLFSERGGDRNRRSQFLDANNRFAH